MGRIRVKYSDRDLRERVTEYKRRVDEMLAFIVDYHATEGQANMKLNAPWTDRTSAARNGLFTVTTHDFGHYTIVFGHSVHYGIWLEVKFSGRDAIIMPTVISQGQALMKDIDRMLT